MHHQVWRLGDEREVLVVLDDGEVGVVKTVVDGICKGLNGWGEETAGLSIRLR